MRARAVLASVLAVALVLFPAVRRAGTAPSRPAAAPQPGAAAPTADPRPTPARPSPPSQPKPPLRPLPAKLPAGLRPHHRRTRGGADLRRRARPGLDAQGARPAAGGQGEGDVLRGRHARSQRHPELVAADRPGGAPALQPQLAARPRPGPAAGRRDPGRPGPHQHGPSSKAAPGRQGAVLPAAGRPVDAGGAWRWPSSSACARCTGASTRRTGTSRPPPTIAQAGRRRRPARRGRAAARRGRQPGRDARRLPAPDRRPEAALRHRPTPLDRPDLRLCTCRQPLPIPICVDRPGITYAFQASGGAGWEQVRLKLRVCNDGGAALIV